MANGAGTENSASIDIVNNRSEVLQCDNEQATRTTEELLRIPVLTLDQVVQLLGEPQERVVRLLKSGQIVGKHLSRRWCIPSSQFLPNNLDPPNTNCATAHIR